jgi:hypothetical protein
MTDLAARIADVKQKAEAAKTSRPKWLSHMVLEYCTTHGAEADYIVAASPDLILAMAALIEELKEEVHVLRRWGDSRYTSWADQELERRRTAARALKGEG